MVTARIAIELRTIGDLAHAIASGAEIDQQLLDLAEPYLDVFRLATSYLQDVGDRALTSSESEALAVAMVVGKQCLESDNREQRIAHCRLLLARTTLKRIVCLHCGREFERKRRKGRYCCGSCRARFSEKLKCDRFQKNTSAK